MIGFPLRVNYKQQDYIYYIISAPSKKSPTIEILLDGKNHTLILNENKLWMEEAPEENTVLEPGLILAISRAVTLRYPI
ncbi:hypothetical protein SAMN05428975_4428 [Mucilaginibacter sp. OK268]|uniref:hypothetical protein n=1 Tax=Mucilaginibacter sp. OK268 TaxID=1881048 RepID=UPI0008918A7A|nr:hypothetical protein [Mucilaginibacter sp. OK268]SDP97197.1 hypothetical protein SAMN05428975_4428 [Mucilaginibacter sp. OK268]